MDILVFDSLHLGEKARLIRLSRHLTMFQVAYLAMEHLHAKGGVWQEFRVQPYEVGALEKGARLHPVKRAAIVAVLGLEAEA